MSYTPISALPDAPSRTEPSTFSTKADAFVAALAGFVTQTNAAGTYINGVGTQVDLDATAAAASATSAEASETIALAAANFKGNWSSLTGALNIPASVFHDDAYWMLISNLADVTTKEPGVDPEWELILSAAGTPGFSGVQVFTSSGTWTKPTGVTKVLMFVTGGGGGQESATLRYSGGAGGTAIKFLDVSSIASSTITIGAGGIEDGNGGDSSWADGTNTITGGGGSGSNTPTGGVATGGDLNIVGGSGWSSQRGGVSFWGGLGAYGSGADAVTNSLFVGYPGVVFVMEFK